MLDLIDKASRWTGGLAIVLCLVMISATLFEVIARRLFNDPTIWSNDVVTMTGGAFFMLAAGTTLLHDKHIKVDIFVHVAPRRLRHGFLALTFLGLFAPTIALIGYTAGTRAWASFLNGTRETVSAWEPLIWPYQTALTLALALFCLQTIAQGIRHAMGLRDGRPLSVGYRTPTSEPEDRPA